MHTHLCRQLHELRSPGRPLPAVPPLAPAGAAEWGARRTAFFQKWQPLIAEAHRELSCLWQRARSTAASVHSRRRSDSALGHAKLAVYAKYRHKLLEAYDEGQRERPAHVLLCEASHVYQAAYAYAGEMWRKGSHQHAAVRQLLELAWQIAGEYLVVIKHMVEQRTNRPGMPPCGLIATSMLPRLVARRGLQPSLELAVEALETVDAVDADADSGGGNDNDDELISTPWSRCA